jgi:hypothetical protein
MHGMVAGQWQSETIVLGLPVGAIASSGSS